MGKLIQASPSILRFLMISCCLLLSSLSFNVSSRTTSLEFTLDAEMSRDNLDDFAMQSLANGSKFPFTAPDGSIFLTQDPTDGTHSSTLYNVGRVSFLEPIPLHDYRRQFFSFDTSFQFNITTTTKYNESGDGIAFVMTTDENIPSNSTGRFLGLMPQSPHDRNQSFLAVEFDTFQNLQAEIHDPSASHIGIDINHLSSVAYLDTADESSPLYLYHNYTFTAWVSYNASTHLIQVWAINSSESERPNNPVVSFTCNLSQVFENHTQVYVGIIAASGNNSQATILYTWSFNMVKRSSPLSKWYIIIPALSGAICLVAATLSARILLRQRRLAKRWQKYKKTIKEASSHGSVRGYKYTELERATQRFGEAQIIGRGGFSTVYMGVLADGTQVAVKRMARDRLDVRMAEAESIAREVKIISKIRHRHLLQLKGWCYERGEALLVYDYMPGGSLESYLYGKKRSLGQDMLDSETRFKIIVGVAAALEYLHGDLPGPDRVLHRDVKAANVLLTDTMEARLADFGLSRLIASDNQGVSLTYAAGTPGYVAPEVVVAGRVDDKADVYSFGVLALEVACGRKALDPCDPQYSRLVDWVWVSHQRTAILDALDPHLTQSLGVSSTSAASSDQVDAEAVQKWRCVMHLGLLCCQADPDARPRMREVHQALKDSRVLAPPTSWVLYPAPPALAQHTPPADESTSAAAGSRSTLYFTLKNIV